jgi:hypothetical protein
VRLNKSATSQPVRDAEVLFTMLLELLGCLVFGLIIGGVGTVLMSQQMLEEKVERQLAE